MKGDLFCPNGGSSNVFPGPGGDGGQTQVREGPSHTSRLFTV